jgi:alkylation response protein AidB-like acyl-CoA dehydrogenase
MAQIQHAAIDLGIARAAYADLLQFVRTRSRPGSTAVWNARETIRSPSRSG